MKSRLTSKILASSLFASFDNQSFGYLSDNSLFTQNANESKKRQPHSFSGTAKQKRLAKKRKNKR